MTLQSIGLRQSRGRLFPLGRIMLAVLLIGGGVALEALRGVLSLGGAASAVSYVTYLSARATS